MGSTFETVVRPSVLPDIRPPWRPVVLPNGNQGPAVLGGSGGQVIELTRSESARWSKQKAIEKQRTYHKLRIPYTNPDGTLDWDRYTEIEVMDKVDFLDYAGKERTDFYAKPQPSEQYEIVASGLTRKNPAIK